MKLLLDANLVVLFVVGLSDQRWISRHKRLQSYKVKDFELLKAVIARSEIIVLTPNTLPETSNLVVQGVAEPLRTRMLETLKAIIDDGVERYMASGVAAARLEYHRLGLTDVALIDACEAGTVLLTDDSGLFEAASRAGAQALCFRHSRAEL